MVSDVGKHFPNAITTASTQKCVYHAKLFVEKNTRLEILPLYCREQCLSKAAGEGRSVLSFDR